MAEQVQRVLPPAGTAHRSGVQGGAQLPGAEAPGLFRQGDRPIQQRLVQGVRDEPQAEVAQRAATDGRMLCAKTVQHHLPALIHHGEFHRVLIADVAVGLQQRSQSQAPSLDGRFAPRLWTIALGQHLLKVRVEQLMPYSAQKDTEFPCLLCTCSNLLLFRAQRTWWVPHGSTPCGARDTLLLHPSEHRCPILSTLSEPLSKQLVSVLVHTPGSMTPEALAQTLSEDEMGVVPHVARSPHQAC